MAEDKSKDEGGNSDQAPQGDDLKAKAIDYSEEVVHECLNLIRPGRRLGLAETAMIVTQDLETLGQTRHNCIPDVEPRGEAVRLEGTSDVDSAKPDIRSPTSSNRARLPVGPRRPIRSLVATSRRSG